MLCPLKVGNFLLLVSTLIIDSSDLVMSDHSFILFSLPNNYHIYLSPQGADPYVYIHCENEKSRSQTMKDTLNPEFKAPFIFFRKKPLNYPIVIEVMFHMLMINFPACAGQLGSQYWCQRSACTSGALVSGKKQN